MSTLENRPNTALLVIDVQNGAVEGAHERDAIVANVGSLVAKAREEDVPVVCGAYEHAGTAEGRLDCNERERYEDEHDPAVHGR